MARSNPLRLVSSAQGPAGAALVVAAVVVLTSWAWGLLAAGGFLLLAAAADAGVTVRRGPDAEDDE